MTLMDNKNEFPSWDDFYKDNDVKKMPWYEKELDKDLEFKIKSMNLTQGKFLDIGTGPGTQAIELAKLGFDATGSDISQNAIDKAKQISPNVNFVVDDVLNSSFSENEFDYILDRGCFHVFVPSSRQNYLKQIKRILKDDGILFLKVMSTEEKDLPEGQGPFRFSQQDILDTFEKDFEVDEIMPTVYYGTLDPLPKAIFAVIKQKI